MSSTTPSWSRRKGSVPNLVSSFDGAPWHSHPAGRHLGCTDGAALFPNVNPAIPEPRPARLVPHYMTGRLE